jgi:predicted protein tyrosine phosphatase
LGNFRAAEGGAGEMMEIRIVTAPEGLALLEADWPTVALSLVGDDLRFPLPSFGPHHLILRFHDVEKEVEGYVAPTEDQLRQALLHTADLSETDRLLVHCHAGKSRSPALAIGILVQAGLSPGAALDRVRAIRPELIPNRLMIRQLDDVLGLQGELVRLVAAHYQALGPKALLPDRGGLIL